MFLAISDGSPGGPGLGGTGRRVSRSALMRADVQTGSTCIMAGREPDPIRLET
jgi:hypothetical protein